MKVSDLAKLMQTTPDTVRYYTRIGLLVPKKDAESGYKIFGKTEQRRLSFILCARKLDFSIEDIEQLLSEADKGHTACPMARELVEKKLAETEQQFQDTIALRARLQKAITDWRDKPDKAPTGDMICHLIEGELDE